MKHALPLAHSLARPRFVLTRCKANHGRVYANGSRTCTRIVVIGLCKTEKSLGSKGNTEAGVVACTDNVMRLFIKF